MICWRKEHIDYKLENILFLESFLYYFWVLMLNGTPFHQLFYWKNSFPLSDNHAEWDMDISNKTIAWWTFVQFNSRKLNRE